MKAPGLYLPTEEDREGYKDYQIIVATPSGGFPAMGFVRSVVSMTAYSWAHGLKIYQIATTERIFIHWARNTLAEKIREIRNPYTGDKFTHILWIDDDHVFDPDTAVRLALSGRLDAVSAVAYRRTPPHLACAFLYANSPTDRYGHHPVVNVPEVVFKVDAIGFGFVLMRVDVFDRIPEPHFLANIQKGEDIGFCMEARKHGVNFWVDGRVKIKHIGIPPEIGFEEHQAWLAVNPPELVPFGIVPHDETKEA